MNKAYNDDSSGDSRHQGNRALFTLVGLGIALFVVGFIVSVTSLSSTGTAVPGDGVSEAAIHTGNESLVLFFGLLLSLGGVVLATAGPAWMFIQARKGSS